MHLTWTKLVETHGEAIYLAAFRILHNVHDVEDVVQETFLEAWQKRDENTVVNWGGWLRTIVVRRSLDRLRKSNFVKLEPVALEYLANPVTPDRLAEDEKAQELQLAIAKLPDQQREIFCLRYFELMANREIAQFLRISETAVSTALHKSRATLNDLLATPTTETYHDR